MIRALLSLSTSAIHRCLNACSRQAHQTFHAGKAVLLVGFALSLFSCSSEDTTDPTYKDWPARNTAAFADTMRTARQAIAAAQASYGDGWTSHTSWRIYPNYTLGTGGKPQASDSIVVRVVSTNLTADQAALAPRPLYTDTVRVAYIGRLMPTDVDPTGKVFDYSGPSRHESDVFNTNFGTSAKFAVSNLVVGFTTALQQMHVGDRWRVFIPAKSAYGNRSQATIPAGSMLIFDMQLREFWRPY